MGTVQKGVASTQATNLLASARHFHFGVDGYTINADGSLNALPSSWEINAGASVTLRYRSNSSGLTPTVDANKVTLIAYYETGTGTTVRTFANAITVADNTTYTFYGTDNGLVGGSPRCGTLRLFIRAVKDDSTGGLSDYNVNTDGASGDDHPGALRVNMMVSDLTVNAYPAASTFAYGVASDETITLTATHTQRYTDRNVETFRLDALDGAATQASGSSKEIGATTTTQDFTADNTFDDASKSYGVKFTTTGQSLLLASEKWAVPVDDGANVTQSGTDAVERQSFYTVDPRISITGTVLSQSLHNRGEAATIDFNVQNARSENLTRSINLQLKDSLGGVKKAVADTGANYDLDYTIQSSDDAAFDLVGKQWTFNTNQSDVDSNPSTNAYSVSSKLLLGSAVGLNDLAVATDEEIYNRGESPQLDYFLSYADGRTLASKTVNSRVHDDAVTSNEEDVQAILTSAGGAVSYSYLISSGDKALFDAVGSPKHVEVDWSGNTTDDSAEEWTVSNKLIVPSYVDADNAGDFWTGKTDLDGDANGDPDGTDETDFFVGADVAYGKVRVQNIRNEDYDGAAITMSLLRNAVISQGPTTGAVSQTASGFTGWQDLFYQFDVKAPAGARVFRVEAAKDGNTTGNATDTPFLTKNVNYAPSYTGNLYAEVNFDAHAVVGDTLRFTLSPIIFATNNDRQNIEDVSPVATVDIDPRYHITVYESSGNPTYGGAQVSMTRITGGNDNHFEATISGLSAYTGQTVNVHIVVTVNGGQLQATFPIVVGKFSPGKVTTRFNPLGKIQS